MGWILSEKESKMSADFPSGKNQEISVDFQIEKDWEIKADFPAEVRMSSARTGERTVCREIEVTAAEKEKGLLSQGGALHIHFSFPMVDISGRWHPVCGFDRAVKADWAPGLPTMAAISAPVVCFYNSEGKNRHTIALSEIRQRVVANYGIREEDGTVSCRIDLELPQMRAGESWRMQIWESVQEEPWWDTLRQVREWWEQSLKLDVMSTPECGRRPMYSFWYSQHQDINEENVEYQSRMAAELGFSAVIVDDGWQTADTQRGYAFCGDWEPEKSKFPDFPAHVQRVQRMGLKYLLWFSVPYVGTNSGAWQRFQDKLLRFDPMQGAGILDLRYPEVREYLKQIYCRAVTDWHLDGLKLDFIDEFYMTPESPYYKEGMDFTDIQEALDFFLTDVSGSLRRLKPDILIEFRQRYIGPQIRKYGNLFRVNDCPGSGITNRAGTIDLRLLSGSTGVHSDMLMWHSQERTEEAVLQIQNCIFSTMQFSVNPEQLSEEKKKALRFWMSFMEQHTDLLQKSQLQPAEPEHIYPEVRAELGDEAVFVHYSRGRIVDLRRKPVRQMYYLHAVKEEEVVFRLEKGKAFRYRLRDCRGEVVQSGCWQEQEWACLTVPTGGMTELEAVRREK